MERRLTHWPLFFPRSRLCRFTPAVLVNTCRSAVTSGIGSALLNLLNPTFTVVVIYRSLTSPSQILNIMKSLLLFSFFKWLIKKKNSTFIVWKVFQNPFLQFWSSLRTLNKVRNTVFNFEPPYGPTISKQVQGGLSRGQRQASAVRSPLAAVWNWKRDILIFWVRISDYHQL